MPVYRAFFVFQYVDYLILLSENIIMKGLKEVLLITFLSVVSSYGQITTTKIPQKDEIIEEVPYDGTVNYLGKDVHKYIGEELYLNGLKEYSQFSGYEGFYLDYNQRTVGNKSNVYKIGDSYGSRYSDLHGKYFTVLDVLEYTEPISRTFSISKFFLKLEDKESKEIVYYLYNSDTDFTFPFIAVKYFAKIKTENVSQKFVLRGRNWVYPFNEIIDVKTGDPVKGFSGGSIWTCVDVSIDERDFKIALVLENSKKEQVMLDIEYVYDYYVFRFEQAELYKKKFGGEKWAKIVEGEVSLGMTKEMCEVSWGKPQYINKTITASKNSEQWVYSDNYLYFDKGVLTAMQ